MMADDDKDTSAQRGKSPSGNWQHCERLSSHERVALKEKAVQDAFDYLGALDSEITKVADKTEREDPSLKELVEWIASKDDIAKKYREFETLVGVAGSTGAGKTSLLNALLGHQEFLPSSCEQAATAVVCQVSWNYDEEPSHEFRAEIVFHTQDEMRKQIDQLFVAVQDRKDIEEQEYEDEEHRLKDIAAAETIIEDVAGKIHALWDFDLEALQGMTTDKLLNSDQVISDLLGTTMYLYDSNPDAFSRTVRPYLDSTTHNHHGGREFAAWPLVKHVRLYIRTNLLKGGICLVDLPGLGDMSDSRATVAQEYYKKLAVTMIVAPIIRAADEKTAIKLLGGYQELRLQMDGRFHRNGFGFVLSKADHINVEGYMKRSKDIEKSGAVTETYKKGKELDVELRKLDGECKQNQKTLRELQREAVKANKAVDRMIGSIEKATPDAREYLCFDLKLLQAERKKATQAVKQYHRPCRRAMKLRGTKIKQRGYLKSRLIFDCTTLRNRAIQARIQSDCRRRRQLFCKGRFHKQGDRDIEVIPVSSVAFWKLKEEDELPGFPRETFTGIPKVKQWLRDAASGRREEHLDVVLNELSGLLNWIQQWSKDQDEMDVFFTKSDVHQVLTDAHERFEELLKQEFSDTCKALRDVNPLRNREEILDHCVQRAGRVISRWHLANPDSQTSTVPMHWCTFQAVLRRDGGNFKSKGASQAEYHWLEDLVVPVLHFIVEQWNEEFNQKLPKIIDEAKGRVKGNWDRYMSNISQALRSLDAQLVGPFSRSLQMFGPICEHIRSKVQAELRVVSESAASAHPELQTDLGRSLQPICEAALAITGNGSYSDRRTLITTRTREKSRAMFDKALRNMETRLNRSKENVLCQLEKTTTDARDSVERMISAVFEGVLAQKETEGLSQSKRLMLQKAIQVIVVQWQDNWKSPRSVSAIADQGDFEIPAAFVEDTNDSDNDDFDELESMVDDSETEGED